MPGLLGTPGCPVELVARLGLVQIYNGIRVFATNSDFLIPISLLSNVIDLRYFKQGIVWDQVNIWVWIIKCSHHQVDKDVGIITFEFVSKTQFQIAFSLSSQ